MRYVGGPLDGRNINTEFDGIHVIRHVHPCNHFEAPETVESYELRRGVYHHLRSDPYPRLQTKSPA